MSALQQQKLQVVLYLRVESKLCTDKKEVGGMNESELS